MSVESIALAADGELLNWFVECDDDEAFAALVRRHGPMVRATSRRLLGDSPEVDDVFQAVFLALAQKAKSIRLPDVLGPWLHTVAVRAAGKANHARLRRQQRERTGMTMPEPSAHDRPTDSPWLAHIDDAVQKLPAKYRDPLVLCELQGISREQAARQLGLAEGTLSSRLARARNLLRLRLLRWAGVLSVPALSAVLTESAAAEVPLALVASTTEAARFGHAPAAVVALTEGVLRTMFYAQVKWLAALTLGIALLLGGIGAVAWQVVAQPGAAAKTDRELLQGTWTIVSAKMKGQDPPADELEKIKMGGLVFKDDILASFKDADMKTRFKCEFKLASAKSPKEIDITPQEGPPNEQGKLFPGIYELKGDHLTICFQEPGKARPKSFDDMDLKVMVLTLKRLNAEK